MRNRFFKKNLKSLYSNLYLIKHEDIDDPVLVLS